MSQPHRPAASRRPLAGFARLPHRRRRRTHRIRGHRPRGTPVLLLLRRFAAFALLITALLLFIRPPADADPASAATATVVVANDDIPAGTAIEPDMLDEQTIPAAQVPDGADLSRAELTGVHTIGTVRTGEIITDARVAELALVDSPGHGMPPGLVPVVVHLTDPAVVSTLAPGMCIDLYAGEAGVPLDQVASDLYVAAIMDRPEQEVSGGPIPATRGTSSHNMRFLVVGVPVNSVNSVASSTSAGVVFATVCADVLVN